MCPNANRENISDITFWNFHKNGFLFYFGPYPLSGLNLYIELLDFKDIEIFFKSFGKSIRK